MKKIMGFFTVALLSSAISLSVYTYLQTRVNRQQNIAANKSCEQNAAGNINGGRNPQQPVRMIKTGFLPETQIDFTKAAESTIDAVVHVKSVFQNEVRYYNPFDFFFGYPQYHYEQQPVIAAGSGVIISPDGYIVTNNHVIEKADEIEVVLNDRRSYKAKVIGVDKTTDIALIKIEENDLKFIGYGNSDDVKVGEWVLAVGNPFNLTSTVTAGIVSAKGRDINIIPDQFKIESFIQTDAAVNPGNSGGALVSSTGELIGINTAIASNTGSYTGYAFAIPVNIVKKVVADLREFGNVQRAFIGISIRNMDSKLASEAGLSTPKGIYVSGLTDNSAADDAGIKEGDVITRINSTDITNVSELQEQVGQHRPGDRIEVTIVRKGKELIMPVVLRNKEGTTELVKAPKEDKISLLGATFEELSDKEKQNLQIDCGVKIAELHGGKLLNAGIREGFIITKIDKKKIYTPEDIFSTLESKKGGILIEGVYPNGMKGYYGFGI